MAVAVTAMVAVAARMVVDGGVGGGGGDGGSLGGEGGGGEEAMAAEGEVVEEANGGGRWCAHTPCAPNTHCGVRGGYGPQPPPRNPGGVEKHRCVYLPRRVTGTEGLGDEQMLVSQ